MLLTKIHGKVFRIDGQGYFTPVEELTLEDWLHDMHAKDAAQKRERSIETVNHHRKTIREKTHAHSVSGVLSFCLSRGYISVLTIFLCVLSDFPIARANRVGQPTKRVETLVRIGRKEISGVIGGAA